MSDEIRALANLVVERLRSLADPVRAENELRYFKGSINNLGVTLPQIETLEKSLCGGLAKTWSTKQAMELCDFLLQMRLFEPTLFALAFLRRFGSRLGEREFAQCEEWLRAGLCDNWAATDSLCNHAVGDMLLSHPELAHRLKTWAGADSRWLRRGSAVSLVLPLRRGEFLDLAYEIALALIRDRDDDLVKKGNGWMLREAGKIDEHRLESFLLAHGPDIPRTTVRYAIERFPADTRRQLLTATRGSR